MKKTVRKKRILLAEAEKALALEISDALKRHGYGVLSADSAEEVLKIALKGDTELVLIDIEQGPNNPGGDEIARLILERKKLPIVFFSDHADRETLDKIKDIKSYGYVDRNSGEFVLTETIRTALNMFGEHQKFADKSRAEYELLLGSTLEAVDSLLVVIDRDYRIVLSNWKNHEWVPFDKRESLPFCYEVMKNRSTPCPNCPIDRVFSKKETVWYDDQNPLDGSYKEISAIPILNRRGEVQYMLENVRDVTERVQTEQHLKRKPEALNSINIREYLKDLLATVFTLSAKPIQIDIRIADRDLNTRIAVPLGLIVNEIATNAIKHGFDPGIKNHFSVSLIENTNAGDFVLVLSNTGPAFPSEVDLDKPDSLGLQLVQTLVKEIGGTMELQRQPSPEFTIRFPMKDI